MVRFILNFRASRGVTTRVDFIALGQGQMTNIRGVMGQRPQESVGGAARQPDPGQILRGERQRGLTHTRKVRLPARFAQSSAHGFLREEDGSISAARAESGFTTFFPT